MKRNNGGFTLVEIMVVIAIMGVLAAMVVISFSTLFSVSARQCASKTDSAITECKTNCMSRAGAEYLCLFMDSDGCLHGIYREDGTDKKDSLLSNRRVHVSYQIDSGEVIELDGTNSLYIAFDRAAGGLCLFGKDTDKTQSAPSDTAQCSVIVTGGNQTYTVTIDALTGSHILNE